MGANHTINAKEQDLLAFLKGRYGSENPIDVALECVSVNSSINQAIRVCKKGGKVVVVGVYSDEPRVNLGWVQDRELELIGTLMYRMEDFTEARDLIARGEVQTNPLITHRFSLREIGTAMKAIAIDPAKNVKVLIDVRQR